MSTEIISIFFSKIESVGIVITLLIGIHTIRQNSMLFQKEKKSDLLTKKRSERIDQLRTQYSAILAEGELKLLGKEPDASKLIYATNYYASLLQYFYEYTDDVELIRLAHQLERLILAENCNPDELTRKMNDFYYKNDMYISIEFSRVSSEISSKADEYQSVSAQMEAANEQKERIKGNYEAVRSRQDHVF